MNGQLKCRVPIGNQYVRQPSRMEQRKVDGSFGQYMPDLDDDARAVQDAFMSEEVSRHWHRLHREHLRAVRRDNAWLAFGALLLCALLYVVLAS